MFCPQCKCEYRPGFTHCSDCDVDLVERLPETGSGSDAALADARLQDVWTGADEDECVDLCKQLTAAEIPFHVIEHSREFFKGVEQAFQILVPADSYERAKEIIGKDLEGFADEAEDQSVTELPAEDDEADPEEVDDDWDPEKWHPEDATVEVWFEKEPKNTWLVELALRENHIHARADTLDDGSQKIFVLQNDESRAREIVEEIKDARPPA